MPANKNAMTRYKFIDEILSDKYRHYSIDEITDAVNKRLEELDPGTNGVCRRTIEKDIYYLENEGPFNVEIARFYDYEAQKKCLQYCDTSFSIFKKELSDDAKVLLRGALSVVGQFDGLPNLGDLQSLQRELGSATDQHKILAFSKNPVGDSSILGELYTYISQTLVIELEYQTFTNPNNPFKVILHPYLLKEYNRRWFLFAAKNDNMEIRCFALDRIKNVRPTSAYQYIPYNGDINERFEDIIGVTLFDNAILHKIVFWVSDTSKDHVRTKPLHESQTPIRNLGEKKLREQYPMLEGGAFFKINCKENYELYHELIGYNHNLIVLEPTEIQNKMVESINKMQSIYKSILTRK